MLKRLLTFSFVLGGFALMAQAPLTNQDLNIERTAAPEKKMSYTGAETLHNKVNPNVPLATNRASMVEETVGITQYDLQSNSGIGRRLAFAPDGTLYGVYTYGEDGAPAFADRGTGLNMRNPDTGEWGDWAEERIETERCGWPSIGVTSDGNPVNVAHTTVQNLMMFNRWDGSAWVENTIPTAVTSGVIWPRLATGGSDGMTVHVIGITYPVANGGAVYEDVDGHVLYYRSTDGGMTWDIQDMKLPELDATHYTAMSADTYFIDANGETVAIGYFDNFGDSKVFKSTDNGSTWEVWNAVDFPIDQYTVDQGYSFDDIPLDTFAINNVDSLAIRTSDQTGTVLVDNDGKVHAWFGEMYVLDDDLTDGNTSYFPATMGLRYWNEDMAENDAQLIVEGILDENENGVADIASGDDIALYFSSMTSHPAAGIDADGNIYLTYSSVSETNVKETATPNRQHNRHVLVMASTDGGDTWTNPWDVTNEDLITEPDLLSLYETQFPFVAHKVDDYMHILYQQDFEPGLAVRGDEDPFGDNFMNYLALDVEEVLNGGFFSGTDVVVDAAELSFEIAPNPASGLVRFTYELTETAPTSITLYDMMGKEVKSYNRGELFAGSYFNTISVADMAAGLYLVRLQTGDKVATQKLQVK